MTASFACPHLIFYLLYSHSAIDLFPCFSQALAIKELESQGAITHFKERWRVEFDKRRKLHHMVLELRGNIRVLVRIRPLLEKERFNAGKWGW